MPLSDSRGDGCKAYLNYHRRCEVGGYGAVSHHRLTAGETAILSSGMKNGDERMPLKSRKNPAALMTMGMSCLMLGVLWPNIVPHIAGIGPNASHFLRGVMFGVSIAMNLMSIVIARRQRGCSGS